ncbi:hypothetical protein BYT27DRAFT_7122753, partial [Phlegmacium glaucopus]
MLELCQGRFMNAPSKEVIDSARSQFIDRTSNSAVAIGICVTCAQETPVKDLTRYPIEHIPNPHRLRPAARHPQHDLYRRMLLHPQGMINETSGRLCDDCVRAL